MAALAYVVLPVTGLIAFLAGRDTRTRFHGLQAITIGLAWPVALYASSVGPPVAVQVTFVVGALVWFLFLLTALVGKDLRLPGVGRYLELLSATTVERRSTSGS